MPSYVIHLATGEEYIKKYKNDIKNKQEFLKGIVEPDQLPDNRKAHDGRKREISSLIKFIENNGSDLEIDFTKGYFLHLYADYLLYSKYYPDVNLYDDYEKVNQYITEKYNVDLPKHLYKYGNYKKGKPEYLTYDFLDNFINEVIDKKIEDRIKELKGAYYEYKN